MTVTIVTFNEKFATFLFVLINILIRRFHLCSKLVKIMLFKTFCLCFYGIALWKSYNITCFNRFKAAYHKCVKLFFGFSRRDSMSAILIELNLPSFDTVICNYRQSFNAQCFSTCSINSIVSHLVSISA